MQIHGAAVRNNLRADDVICKVYLRPVHEVLYRLKNPTLTKTNITTSWLKFHHHRRSGSETFCLNTKTILDLLLTTNETTIADGSPHEEGAAGSIVLKVDLDEESLLWPRRPLGGPKDAKRKLSEDQAVEGESQTSPEKWVPTKSDRQHQKTKESRWVEKTKAFHEAGSIMNIRGKRARKKADKGKKNCRHS